MTESITLETSRGKITLIPQMMDAMEGWEVKKQLKFYLESEDDDKGAALRKRFTIRVLSWSRIPEGDDVRKILTEASINDTLETWGNVKLAFDAILTLNGIDPEMSYEAEAQATKVGEAMGQGFWAQCISMMEPLIESYVKAEAEKTTKD